MALAAAADPCSSLVEQGRKAFDAREFSQAASRFEEALAVCPKNADLLVSLGQTRYLAGNEEEAERSMLAALAINPDHETGLYNLGRLYYAQNRFPQAVERLGRVTAINPRNYRAWDNLGVTYDAMNRDSDALRAFFKALDLVTKDVPTYEWAHANLANFFLRRNQFEKAFQLAAEAAGRNPNSARCAYLTGKALVQLDKHELSLRWLERAVELNPRYADAFYQLAQAYRKLGMSGKAQQAIARFQELSKQPRER